MNGKVVSINISEKKGTIKTPVDNCRLIEDFGIENDAHAGKGIRQVSLLGVESIEKMKNLGVKGLCSGKFAENITTSGIILHELKIGTILHIGETTLEVTQIGKECHGGCEIKQQVGHCIMPLEGIFAKVIQGGIVTVGEDINIPGDFNG